MLKKSSLTKDLYQEYQVEQQLIYEQLEREKRLSDLIDNSYIFTSDDLAVKSMVVPEFSVSSGIVLPDQTALFECTNSNSVKAVNLAYSKNRLIFISNMLSEPELLKYDKLVEEYKPLLPLRPSLQLIGHTKPLFLARVGCLAQVISLHEDSASAKTRVLVRGVARAAVESAGKYNDYNFVRLKFPKFTFSLDNLEEYLDANDLKNELRLAGTYRFKHRAKEVVAPKTFIEELPNNYDFTLEHYAKLLAVYLQKWQVSQDKEKGLPGFAYGNLKEFSSFLDMTVSKLPMTVAELLFHLFNNNVVLRALAIINVIRREIGLQVLRVDIDRKTKDLLNKEQREYMLRNAIKVLHNELNNGNTERQEIDILHKILNKKALPPAGKKFIEAELERYKNMGEQSPEAASLHAHIMAVLTLPWGRLCKDHFDIEAVRKQLDSDHFGLTKVKERIVEYLAVLELQKRLQRNKKAVEILCLIGPPGVGKTSVAASIAKALGRPFQRVSVGGLHDEAEIRGHRRTYIGSMPGRIMKAVSEAACDNPVILLDEIDKLVNSLRGDPAAALLEVLDPEQNSKFYDNYIDMPYDLSKVLFITTANSADTIPEALYDRMDVVYLSAYTTNEKVAIARNHLWPRLLDTIGISGSKMPLSKAVVMKIINDYTREAGVRQLERCLNTICRKMALRLFEDKVLEIPEILEKADISAPTKSETKFEEAIAPAAEEEVELTTAEERAALEAEKALAAQYLKLSKKMPKIEIKTKDLSSLLGTAPYIDDEVHKHDMVGVVTGLAWTAIGGVTLEVEAQATMGNGKISLTGNLGDVMKESAEVAWTYIRSQAKALKLDLKQIGDLDVHIHFPEGAVPKDGPSAGVTLATALCSLLLQKKVKHKIAMTGEVTLTGRVFPVGGIKEKLMAAYRAKVDEVLIPEANLKDLDDVDSSVKDAMKITPVTRVEEVWQKAIIDFKK